jgi:hypothetical protein
MADTPEHLAVRLKEEGEKTLAFFDPLTPDQWTVEVYTDGMTWSVREVLCHIAITEASFGRLLENIIAGGDGSPEDFNIDAYNERKVAQMEGAPLEVLTESYRQARLRNVEIVSNLRLEDLERRGRHPFLGVAPLVDIIKLIYRHNQLHLRDVRKLLQ